MRSADQSAYTVGLVHGTIWDAHIAVAHFTNASEQQRELSGKKRFLEAVKIIHEYMSLASKAYDVQKD